MDTSDTVRKVNIELAHMSTLKTLMLLEFDRAEDYEVLNKILRKYNDIVQSKRKQRASMNPFARFTANAADRYRRTDDTVINQVFNALDIKA